MAVCVGGAARRIGTIGLLQPTLQPFLKAAAHLLKLVPQAGGFLADLVPPAAGAAQEFLAHAGPGQGQFIQLGEGGDHLARLLIEQAIGSEAPATATGKPRITAGHQVMENAAAAELHGRIGNAAQHLALLAN